MAEESFKERARQEMIKAAKQYKDIYVDYEYLICSVTFEKNDYYIIAAEEDNFQHLTGVQSKIDAKTFFRKCYDGTLAEVDFDFAKAGLAKKCEIQLSYAIGVAHPTSIMVDTFGTGKLSDEKLVEIVRENFDLRPAGIIKMLDLRRPIYKATAAYGHFGRTDVDLPWEATDKVDVLKKYL